MQSHQAFDAMFVSSINARVPFLVHPLALDARVDIRRGAENHGQEAAAAAAKEAVLSAIHAQHHIVGHIAGERLAQAAKHLYDQAKESRVIFEAFHNKYTKDINGVRQYVSGDTRRRIWDEKVKHNIRYSKGKGKEDEQLAYQHNKLKICITRFNESANDVTTERRTSCTDVHDSQGLQLEKVRTACNRMGRLAEKALLDQVACKDFINELRELIQLVDPKQPTGAQVYRFDKREIRAVRLGDSDVDDSEVRVGGEDRQAENGGDEQADGRDWTT
jgi:hypothetical protein